MSYKTFSAAKIAVTIHQDNMSDFKNKTDAGEPNNFSKYHRFLKVNPVWCKVEMYYSKPFFKGRTGTDYVVNHKMEAKHMFAVSQLIEITG